MEWEGKISILFAVMTHNNNRLINFPPWKNLFIFRLAENVD